MKNFCVKNLLVIGRATFCMVFTLLAIFTGAIIAEGMEYVDIAGNDGKIRRFSRLVMGTDHLCQAGWVDEKQPEPCSEQVYEVLNEAARLGINLFDTAPIYVGDVEKILGEWRANIAGRIADGGFLERPSLNPDRKIYVLSKGGFPFDLFWLKELPGGCHSGKTIGELKKREIIASNAAGWRSRNWPLKDVPPGTYLSRLYCEKALMIERISAELTHTRANLKGDIDIYLMHRDDGDAVGFAPVQRAQTPVARILEAVSAPEISSRVKIIGWSNWKTPRVNESLRLAERNKKLVRPMINSPYFSLFEMSGRTIHALGVQAVHRDMMDHEFQKGIKIMPYSPLGGFSILDKPAPAWENAKSSAYKKYSADDPYWQNVYPAIFTPENEARWYRAVKFLDHFNKKHRSSYTIDQLLNAYVLAHPRTDMLAIGAVTAGQVRRTVKALEMSKMLSRRDLEFLYSGKIKPCAEAHKL
ncbi:MAG: Aldo/keto reductase family protein [bacterium ADurb.Bin243]|nr:MAG: Aldo/keto reductase family protein [bacterium ADurb.Bin243]